MIESFSSDFFNISVTRWLRLSIVFTCFSLLLTLLALPMLQSQATAESHKQESGNVEQPIDVETHVISNTTVTDTSIGISLTIEITGTVVETPTLQITHTQILSDAKPKEDAVRFSWPATTLRSITSGTIEISLKVVIIVQTNESGELILNDDIISKGIFLPLSKTSEQRSEPTADITQSPETSTPTALPSQAPLPTATPTESPALTPSPTANPTETPTPTATSTVTEASNNLLLSATPLVTKFKPSDDATKNAAAALAIDNDIATGSSDEQGGDLRDDVATSAETNTFARRLGFAGIIMGTLLLMIAGTLWFLWQRRTPKATAPVTLDSSIQPVPQHHHGIASITLPDGTTIPLSGDATPFTIGRADSNLLPIDHPSVSRQHARIVRMPIGAQTVWVIEDLSSPNGVRVNGLLTPKAVLSSGTSISIGAVDCNFIMSNSDESM